MVTLQSIHSAETLNRSQVFFYREEDQWRAFNRSAWFVATFLSPHKAPRALCQQNLQMVYYSFTQEELDELLSSYKFLSRKEDKVICDIGQVFNINAYYNWKAGILNQNRALIKVESVPAMAESSRSRLDKNALLREKIANFDLDNSTSQQCFIFIKELKNLLSDDGL